MKFKVSMTRLAGRREWEFEVVRTSAAESARFHAEDAARYWACLEAVRAAPGEAREIVEGVLGNDGSQGD